MGENLELRIIASEIRVAAADGKPSMSGYAAVFNSQSADLGGFREVLLPGCFADSLTSGDDIRALFSHDPDKLLGRTSNQTLRLKEDEKGLWFECDLPDTSYSRDLQALLSRGDIRKMSFGFNVPDGGDKWNRTESGLVRTVTSAKIAEVSAVSNPAYQDTAVSLRAMEFVRNYELPIKIIRHNKQRLQILRPDYKAS